MSKMRDIPSADQFSRNLKTMRVRVPKSKTDTARQWFDDTANNPEDFNLRGSFSVVADLSVAGQRFLNIRNDKGGTAMIPAKHCVVSGYAFEA